MKVTYAAKYREKRWTRDGAGEGRDGPVRNYGGGKV